MEMTMRWYGSRYDTVTLSQIRQTAYVTGVISTLYGKMPGEVWEKEEILALKKEIEDAGLRLSGIESVNVSDAVKSGSSGRDRDIEAYIQTLRNLGETGIPMVCYNFMPVFDFTRTKLNRRRADGSFTMAYSQKAIDAIDPSQMFESLSGSTNGTVMPGWEPERMAKVRELFALYRGVDEQVLFRNLVYFLKAIMPVCDKYNINMAIHPDDPAWSVFGLARIVNSEENILRILKAVDNPHNGITVCSGSLGSRRANNIPSIIRKIPGRVHFAHVRNLKFNDGERDFEEAAHLSSDGSFDLYEIMKALYDINFRGPIRPDHGRMIWGEAAMPGYGLYDRALGAAYLCGLWEAIAKEHR